MHPLAQLDHRYLWHPFTQMQEWLQREPILIVSGKGAVVRDAYGREYLDANASIWTNLHGHNHPFLNAALRRQLRRIAHSSALGLANEPASLLAAALIKGSVPCIKGSVKGSVPCNGTFSLTEDLPAASASKAARSKRHAAASAQPQLTKVFFSDDGSTAMEVALKLAYEYTRRSGRSQRPRFLSLAGAYHGDTIGAVSLGYHDRFHSGFRDLLFRTDTVMSPYCYRCPHNRAEPERADAREYRQCHWECIDRVEASLARQRKRGNPYAAMVVEPQIQGAAGMIPQPPGWLSKVAELVRADEALLIADEVMTGFGRTGSLFACHREGVQPDLMAVAKGLTGGYLPMAATLATRAIFEAYLGEYAEFKTFFHGHSYTANQLGAATALASLELLQRPANLKARSRLAERLRESLQGLWSLPQVGDIRQVGLIAGIELVRNWRTREPFDLRERAGMRVCEAMARRGVLTRPIGNVVVVMPPFCMSGRQVNTLIAALHAAVDEGLGR